MLEGTGDRGISFVGKPRTREGVGPIDHEPRPAITIRIGGEDEPEGKFAGTRIAFFGAKAVKSRDLFPRMQMAGDEFMECAACFLVGAGRAIQAELDGNGFVRVPVNVHFPFFVRAEGKVGNVPEETAVDRGGRDLLEDAD